jgi:FAD/FMN-containing dehydrogenase/Fe-S oxidoreductase
VASPTLRPAGGRPGDPALAEALGRALQGEVLFEPADRARYATDASIYQIEPLGVVCPRDAADVAAALAVAREAGVSVIARGAGTSQAGQTVGRSLVMDMSRWLTGRGELDLEARTVWVEPGLVLDDLNRALRPHGLFYPVDVSTASRATLGGMTANNACGARSLRYGVSIDNVLEIEALLADGTSLRCGPVTTESALTSGLRAIARREAGEIARRWPRTARQVGGYALDRVAAEGPFNLASLLVGSEGTLACFTRIKLQLHPLPRHKLMGVCHFPSFRGAMAAAAPIVALGPTCVELVDRSILELARAIPAFAEKLGRFVRGAPDALLLVEFAGEDAARNRADLVRLHALMGDLGLPGAVLDAVEPRLQAEITELRTAGLNIAMSMRGAGKPVSFIEDCAVPLAHLADYTAALDELFARHGTSGTWYAHAAVGCLHVRPILNLRLERDRRAMRAIAEEAVALVRRFKGTHSGEHGDGLARSEWHERVFGTALVRAFEEVKDLFDPTGLLNSTPSKIVRAPPMDSPELLRAAPGADAPPLRAVLDWSAWGGLLGAAEMCNNNGACRAAAGGVMCPSFRATRAERDVTRGRANVLRWALTGRLGADALASPAMRAAMDLCVGCKACRRECPTGVDMARMKLELRAHWAARDGVSLRDRLIAELPRLAPWAARLRTLVNRADRLPGGWRGRLGLAAGRSLPRWRRPWRGLPPSGAAPAAVLFADCFNRYLEPDNLRAAERVVRALDLRPVDATPAARRPLCCGRTYLAAGLVERARAEARRTLAALRPLAAAGLSILGLEPACVLTFRDELPALLPDEPPLAVVLLAELVAGRADRLPPLAPVTGRVLLHGHCHERAHGCLPAVEASLALIPGLAVETLDGSCCGMAGSFGYEAEHAALSRAMAEASLLPALRAAPDARIAAGGVSCRQQIRDLAGREALHPVRLLAEALPAG